MTHPHFFSKKKTKKLAALSNTAGKRLAFDPGALFGLAF